MQRRLLAANLHNDMSMVAEVVDLLETVKSGWDAIEPQH
jgi:flagellar protein FliS